MPAQKRASTSGFTNPRQESQNSWLAQKEGTCYSSKKGIHNLGCFDPCNVSIWTHERYPAFFTVLTCASIFTATACDWSERPKGSTWNNGRQQKERLWGLNLEQSAMRTFNPFTQTSSCVSCLSETRLSHNHQWLSCRKSISEALREAGDQWWKVFGQEVVIASDALNCSWNFGPKWPQS